MFWGICLRLKIKDKTCIKLLRIKFKVMFKVKFKFKNSTLKLLLRFAVKF